LAWKIELTELVFKQLKKIGHSEAKLIIHYLRNRIEPLDDPRQIGQDNELIVLVVRVGHRKGVYEK